MKRTAKVAEKKVPAAEPARGLRIEFDSEVLRRIRQHARSSMSAEICGVLIGSADGPNTVVEASIPGEEARQGGSHVTFTQETWTHIYQVKDSQYPDKRIVGWYHSHPGFGVFLSEHDTFIHRNFFSNANQVAWVFDPHSDEEGCFAWKHDEIVRVSEMAVRDRPDTARPARKEAGEAVGGGPGGPPHRDSDDVDAGNEAPSENRGRRVGRWIGLALSHLLVLVVGFVIGFLISPPVVVMPDRGGQRPNMASPAPQGDQKK